MPRLALPIATFLLLAACGGAASGHDGGTANAAASTPAAAAAPASTPAVEPVATAAAAPAAAPGAAEAAFARQMAAVLVGHATLDGRDVRGVRAIDKCHTAFATADGETVIDWTKMGNTTPHDAGGREVTMLTGGDRPHALSVALGTLPEPAGNAAERSSGAFGQLALECAS